MNKLSKSARELVVKQANELIAKSSTPELRSALYASFSRLLSACDAYRGFNYAHWIDKGYNQWVADGRPDDNTPYLGDQTMIVFY